MSVRSRTFSLSIVAILVPGMLLAGAGASANSNHQLPRAPLGYLADPLLNSQASVAADNVSSMASASAAWTTSHRSTGHRATMAKLLGPAAVSADANAASIAVGRRFAGTRITAAGLEVSLATPSEGVLARQVQQLAGRVPTSVRWVARTERQLLELTSRISGDESRWNAQGIRLGSWGPDYATNSVSVQFAARPAAGALAAFRAAYGQSVTVRPELASVARRSSRTDDRTPFVGGDRAVDHTRNASCTSGFNLKRPDGTTWLTTAGHCSGGTGSGLPLAHLL
jgi:hypothetical protein